MENPFDLFLKRYTLVAKTMTLDTLIMLSGVAVAIVPFFGFPPSWSMPILVILGVFILALGIVVRRRATAHALPRQDEQPKLPLDDGEVA